MKNIFFTCITLALIFFGDIQKVCSQQIKGGVDIEVDEADRLPKAADVLSNIKIGWNLGGSLEIPEGETAGGNPKTTQKTIDFIKKQGFNAVRIPFYVSTNVNTTCHISKTWLKRVSQIADYCIKDSMYVIIVPKYTDGWIKYDGNKDYDMKLIVGIRDVWEQIANHFSEYDEHVIFSFSFRTRVNSQNYAQKYILLQQNFIDAVRTTGRKNMYRTLIVQGFDMDISKTVKFMRVPSDYHDGYLAIDVAYYTPWQFCGLLNDESWGKYVWFWGSGNHQDAINGVDRNAPQWSEVNFMDEYLGRIKRKYADKGIPVVISECGVIRRSMPNLKMQKAHENSRFQFMYEIAKHARSIGMPLFVWDDGKTDINNMGLIRRSDLTIFDSNVLKALNDGCKAGDNKETK